MNKTIKNLLPFEYQSTSVNRIATKFSFIIFGIELTRHTYKQEIGKYFT